MTHDHPSLLLALRDQFAANRGVNLLNDEPTEYVSVSPVRHEALAIQLVGFQPGQFAIRPEDDKTA